MFFYLKIKNPRHQAGNFQLGCVGHETDELRFGTFALDYLRGLPPMRTVRSAQRVGKQSDPRLAKAWLLFSQAQLLPCW